MEKILTIAVPTYNMEAYLDACLSSMIMDDPELMAALEVIVVNDGSLDRSLDIAMWYKGRFPNTFLVIDKENGNYGSCVNRALKEARGKYFRIVDADDWVDTTALKDFIEGLKEIEIDLVMTPYCIESVGDITRIGYSNKVRLNYEYNIKSISYHLFDSPLQMHGMTYRTSILHQCNLRLTEGVSYTDTEYCFYPLSYIQTLVFWSMSLYHYRADRDGQTMSVCSLKKSTQSMLLIAKKMLRSNTANYEDMKSADCIMSYQVLNRLLWLFYYTSLVLCKKSKHIENQLNEIHSIIYSYPSILNGIRNFKYNRIRFVLMWEMTGLYNSSLVMSLYNRLFSYLKRIKYILKFSTKPQFKNNED